MVLVCGSIRAAAKDNSVNAVNGAGYYLSTAGGGIHDITVTTINTHMADIHESSVGFKGIKHQVTGG